MKLSQHVQPQSVSGPSRLLCVVLYDLNGVQDSCNFLCMQVVHCIILQDLYCQELLQGCDSKNWECTCTPMWYTYAAISLYAVMIVDLQDWLSSDLDMQRSVHIFH